MGGTEGRKAELEGCFVLFCFVFCQSNQEKRVMRGGNCGVSRLGDESQGFGLGPVKSKMPSSTPRAAMVGSEAPSPEVQTGVKKVNTIHTL